MSLLKSWWKTKKSLRQSPLMFFSALPFSLSHLRSLIANFRYVTGGVCGDPDDVAAKKNDESEFGETGPSPHSPHHSGNCPGAPGRAAVLWSFIYIFERLRSTLKSGSPRATRRERLNWEGLSLRAESRTLSVDSPPKNQPHKVPPPSPPPPYTVI